MGSSAGHRVEEATIDSREEGAVWGRRREWASGRLGEGGRCAVTLQGGPTSMDGER